MQDKPENPTAAIHIMLDQTDLYNRFNVGREIYINLKVLEEYTLHLKLEESLTEIL